MEGRPLDETELIRRAQNGDAGAYEELVRAHEHVAFRTAFLITGGAADAEEAAQNGFLKAYRNLARFDTSRPFRPWLLKIVGNEARNQRRAAGRRSSLELRVLEEDRRREDAAPSPEAAILERERASALMSAVNELPERDRHVIACRFFLDLSEEETARALGCARGTVKSRLSRALGRLKAVMGDDLELSAPEVQS